jgi:hypothetical protein
MNVNGISTTNQVTELNALSSLTSNTTTDSTDTSSIGDAAVPHMSGPGKLMSKLAQLKSSDPSQFQSVVSDMASKLKDAAAQATGQQATFLTNLSNKLTDIANGGDISELKPGAAGAAGGSAPGGPQGAHHGHHHHHGGGGMASSDSSSDSSSETSLQSTLASVFGELDTALGGSTASSSTQSA